MDTRKIFPFRLAELRKERGLTQGELADRIGISRQSVTLYERETRIPDIEVLAEIASFFGVTADYLIGLSDARTHETEDISARTGLSETAVEVLEFYRELNEGAEAYINDSTPAVLVSEMLESSMVSRDFLEFIEWVPACFRDIIGENGKYLGSLSVTTGDDGAKRISHHWSKDGEHKVTPLNDITPSEYLPQSFVDTLKAAYEKYCALSRRNEQDIPLIDNINEFLGNCTWDSERLLINTELGISRVIGGYVEEVMDKEYSQGTYGLLADLCSEDTPGILSLPISEFIDDRSLKRIRKSLTDLRKIHHRRCMERIEEALDCDEEEQNAQEE